MFMDDLYHIYIHIYTCITQLHTYEQRWSWLSRLSYEMSPRQQELKFTNIMANLSYPFKNLVCHDQDFFGPLMCSAPLSILLTNHSTDETIESKRLCTILYYLVQNKMNLVLFYGFSVCILLIVHTLKKKEAQYKLIRGNFDRALRKTLTRHISWELVKMQRRYGVLNI